MAANYWDSTQRRHWQFTKTQLASMRQKLEDDDPSLVQMFPLPQLRHLNIWFNQRKCCFSQNEACAVTCLDLCADCLHVPIPPL